MPNPIPWVYSPHLGDYVWNPRTDQITTKAGQIFPRPAAIPRASLIPASYEGSLPSFDPQYSSSPTRTSHYVTRPGPANPVGHTQAVGSPPGMQSLTNAMGKLNARNAGKGKGPPPQKFTPQKEARVAIATQHPNRNIRTRINIDKEGVTSSLFPEFKSQKSRFFKKGRVFLVLWSEPAGAGGNDGTVYTAGGGTTVWEEGVTLNQFQERVFSKVRRFVVIREGRDYCNALPISTYGGRGVAKFGVVKSEHCIIFTGKTPPNPTAQERQQRDEEGMRPVPIRVDPDTPVNTLDVMSRLNLVSIMTVQHNIKVKPFGTINERSVDALMMQHDNAWGGAPVPGPSTRTPFPRPAEEEENDDEDDDDDEGDDDGEDEEEQSEEEE